MSSDLQDAVTLAMDPEIATAITITQTELEHVRELRKLRPDDQRWIEDELEVLARLADLKVQAVTK